MCRPLYLFDGVRELQPPRSHRLRPGPTERIGQRQDKRLGATGEKNSRVRGIIELLVFGSLRSLRPLKEEQRASGLRRNRGTGILPTGGSKGYEAAIVGPEIKKRGNPRGRLARLGVLEFLNLGSKRSTKDGIKATTSIVEQPERR
jgi:hypothetical protein